jgi:hypothetical protein
MFYTRGIFQVHTYVFKFYYLRFFFNFLTLFILNLQNYLDFFYIAWGSSLISLKGVFFCEFSDVTHAYFILIETLQKIIELIKFEKI